MVGTDPMAGTSPMDGTDPMTGTDSMAGAGSAAGTTTADPQHTQHHPSPTRRTFLKWSAAVGGTAALASTVTNLGMPHGSTAHAATEGIADADRTVWSACTVNCGSRCPLRLQVKDGTVVRVLPDNTGTDQIGSQRVRACVRGRSIRHRIYNPDRLKKPLKRKPGTKRGDEQWQEISWDQALDEIAAKMTQIKADYGNEAIYINYGTGTLGSTISKSCDADVSAFARLMNTWGGYLDHYSDYSTTEITAAYPYFYGSWVDGNSFDDVATSHLQVLFGNNPIETRMSGGGQLFVTQQMRKEHAVRTIVIDPRYSETAVDLADEWIPIRPGTDAALVAGMIHVMVAENLHDQGFLDTYCIGFDDAHMPDGAPANASYRAYLAGRGADGVEKTPEWAASITGVPADQIRRLAREIALAKPCAITQGWGPQRQANGENTARAIFLLAAVTGNIGVSGGGTGARESARSISFVTPFNKGTTNPSKKIIPVFAWLDAIDHGEQMDTFNAGVCEKPASMAREAKVPVDDNGNPTNIKLDVPIKMVWQYGGNSIVNQTGDNNKSVEILRDDSKCELIVNCDIQYTTSCRYSDYILPGTSAAEEADIHPGSNGGPMAYGIISQQAIEPLYECHDIYWICTQLARRLGTEQAFTQGRSREDWLRATIDATRAKVPDLPDYDDWKQRGIFRKDMGPVIALADFRADPVAHALETPSGKIEIYSQRLARMSEKWEYGVFRDKLPGDSLHPLPEFVDTWEGALAARASREYPFQVIGHHYKARTHSTYGNVDWMKEAHRQQAWINILDARNRGIADGDQVFLYNDRGTIRLEAKVTERIMPGVISVPQGAWYAPKSADEVKPPPGANPERPVDTAGSVNSLTSLHPSPLARGNAVHTTIANVVKA
ncbi:molybdopterin-dependent oxidoreductase [Propionibacterium freudenreichii]|nr:twin-arginine translocation signal domain-containing protein [Propionibacterium freudenreichii]MDK9611795.1 molybdopterin-dependent oxidoreductase [Propionibacterium freudenreichii]MDK9620740.1 molybdopterin-dependent oxidoreductase [Propionibacterium freudenreichii]MDK9622500.1 molybdopterin-dependent oxidoreductase [Propionibacterium freudenreichii]